MGLLQKLKDVRVTKQNYFVLQHRFYAELSKKFPHLMNSNMATIANTLETELHLLLCTALKYKSIKLRLTSGRNHYSAIHQSTYVNVQRSEPGFYYPRSMRSGSDINYMNLSNVIDDNNDMLSVDRKDDDDDDDDANDDNESNLKVALSELKKPDYEKQIVSRNLDAYYKLLKEVMAYRQSFLCYLNVDGAHIKFGVKGLDFYLQAKSMIILIKIMKDSGPNDHWYHSHSHPGSPGNFQYDKNNDDLLNLLTYSKENSRDFDKYIHERLKIFINNYEEIYINFEREEQKKRKVCKTCLNFIKQIQVYTLPFKILNEITNKKI